jgi:hypothetical protein
MGQQPALEIHSAQQAKTSFGSQDRFHSSQHFCWRSPVTASKSSSNPIYRSWVGLMSWCATFAK